MACRQYGKLDTLVLKNETSRRAFESTLSK
jgi:hypothetical protein